ncbi:peptidoglycan DD-metalloendopeptidase family protein [Pedobacter sp. AW1-32]|uniref:peptidoglycan DD-metalloendopeptidase family protein n=1 Tax=Pedobacter sp. AW1-32 TaxID=3383026 RepID=UPI003FF10156
MEDFKQLVKSKKSEIKQVVNFDASIDRVFQLDFTVANTELSDEILNDTYLFSKWVNQKLTLNRARYGIGGYDEHRTIYSRSAHFSSAEEPRRLHLGVDIWAPAATPIYNFHEAVVHSFANNDHFGDYGATIILQYDFSGFIFYALYGHLSFASLDGLFQGKVIAAGEEFTRLGNPDENGSWPPHLHFQLILDMEGKAGDYPGVCRFSERARYLANCPDPNLILQQTFGF